MCKPFINFVPAQLSVGKKDTYVSYYATNPFTNKLERKRIRINHIKTKAERLRYGRLLCLEINEKLYKGWNPFLDELQSANSPTLQKAVKDFLTAKEKTIRPDSFRSYKSICKMFAEWLEINGMENNYVALFSTDHARRFMRHLESNYELSNKTYNNYLSFMTTLFLYFVKKEFLKDNPFASIDKKRSEEKSRAIIPAEQRSMILEYYRQNGLPEFEWVMKLCYRLLIRPKEIMMLKIADIDYDKKVLTVPGSVAKNHHARMLGIPDDMMGYFETLRDLDKKLYIFSDGYKPGRVEKNTRDVGRTWSIMRNKLKLPASYQFYSLKDTGITEMLEAGVPAKFVKDLADHHSLSMTERYTHKTDAIRIRDSINLEF